MKQIPSIIFGLLFLLSCKTPHFVKKNLIDNHALSKAQTDSISTSAINTGIDFIAFGNIPSEWKLTMDFDNKFIFSLADHSNQIVSSPVNSEKIADAAGETFFCNNGKERMDVTLFDGGCNSWLTGNPFVKSTEVKIGETIYKGCGNFLYDQRINDIWVLEYIDFQKQYSDDYPKGIPRIEINLNQRRMTGSDGCNEIECLLEMRGNRIQFSNFFKPYADCTYPTAARLFRDQISNKLVEYYFKDGNMIFYLSNDTRLVFRKAD